VLGLYSLRKRDDVLRDIFRVEQCGRFNFLGTPGKRQMLQGRWRSNEEAEQCPHTITCTDLAPIGPLIISVQKFSLDVCGLNFFSCGVQLP